MSWGNAIRAHLVGAAGAAVGGIAAATATKNPLAVGVASIVGAVVALRYFGK